MTLVNYWYNRLTARANLFLAWYAVLRAKQYKMLLCVEWAWHNSKYYTTDGKYRNKDK